MKALILNSGLGKRMEGYTEEQPKCMVSLLGKETIIERQLKQLWRAGITDVVITSGPFQEKLENYVTSLNLPIQIVFVQNPEFLTTNYIYSIYLAKACLDDDLILLHGDLVFTQNILNNMLDLKKSCMAVSTVSPLPEKDFKAVISNGTIIKVGIEFFDQAAAAQPLYVLTRKEWNIWLNKICTYCEAGKVSCYAENAFNEVGDQMQLTPFDYKDGLCQEIDNEQDLVRVRHLLETCDFI